MKGKRAILALVVRKALRDEAALSRAVRGE